MVGVKVDYKAVIAGGVVLVGLYWLAKKEVTDLAAAVNPVDPKNVINTGFNTAYAAVTDGQGSLGTDVWEAIHHGDGSYRWPWEEYRPIDWNKAD